MPLMAALLVVVSRVLGDRVDQIFSPRKSSDRDTRLDRPHEPFRIRVHVRCLVRREQNSTPNPERSTGTLRKDRVSIDDEEALPPQEALSLSVRFRASVTIHPEVGLASCRRRGHDACDVDDEQREVA